MSRCRLSPRRAFGAVLTLALVAAVVRSGPAAEPPSRDRQLEEIEKQIKELNRKLEEIRRGDGRTAGADGALPADWVKVLHWRCIGPAAMGGRITAFSVFEGDPCCYWVATASGGLLKTTNNGVTFEHQFDHEATVSVGDVCVAPSNRDIVWVGTGENNPRNSVSYGDGVYKSTDGGKTWKNMGLPKTFQIGKIVVHPKNPDVVYVGALGRLYGPNEDRGLYKTTDGGKTWEKVLYVDDKTGVIDLKMSPADPETLLVAMWERQRDGFDSHPGNDVPVAEGYDRYDPIKKWGPGSGLYKTTDGGKTFKKITQGLPTCPLGRIGIDFYRKDPKVVYAIVDSQKIGMGLPPPQVYLGIQGETTADGFKVGVVAPDSPAAKAGLKKGDVIQSIDKKDVKTYADVLGQLRDKKADDKLALRVKRDKETPELTVTLAKPPAAGGDFEARFRGAFLLGVFGEDADEGVKVTAVFDEGSAAKAGLEEGDVIKSLDKKPVESFQQLVQMLNERKDDEKITLNLVREKEAKELAVTLHMPPPGFGPGTATKLRPYSFWYGGQRENVQEQQGPDGHEYGGVYKSTDAGDTWTRINSANPRPMYFSCIRVDPSDDKYIYLGGIALYRSKDGGKTFQADGGNGVHPDQHALWIDPRDGRHILVGCDGGYYVTYDRMNHWDHLNHMAIGQFYHVALDNRRPYRAFGGMQDNGSWGGPSRALAGNGPINEDWLVVGGGDGFVCRVDPTDSDMVYFESQDGSIGRYNLRTGKQASIQPKRSRTGSSYRFNWNTPFILSAHNPHLFYCGGNYVFRSVKQGDDLRIISPEITRTKRGSATALAESPKNPDVLYAGTDDGALWVTRDGGAKWTEVSKNVGLPGPRWVATIEPSRFKEGRAYVAFDAHRSDDDEPYVYVTEDYGQTWKSIRGNLPVGSSRTCREDVQNPDLLFVGTEFGAWVSLNRGGSWTRLNNNLPTVAVHEFAIHPTAGEMVIATHGRSLWVLDVSPLRQMTAEALQGAHLYEPNAVVRWRSEPLRGTIYGSGSRHYYGENPQPGAQIYYSLAAKADKVSLKILDYAGQTVRELEAKPEAGLHRVSWDLAKLTSRPPAAGRGRGRRGGDNPFGPRGRPVPEGTYRVVLTVDGKEFSQPLRIEADPTTAGAATSP